MSELVAPVDLLVIGSGVAGLSTALDAVDAGLRPLVATRSAVGEGSTEWAQGGLAVVVPGQAAPGDTVQAHVEDTLTAGAGLSDPEVVHTLLSSAAEAVNRLRRRGAVFDLDSAGRYLRTREGGHRAFRVIRAGGDATGAEVERALVEQARTTAVPVLERHRAQRLWRDEHGAVVGADLVGPDGSVIGVPARAVVLATGGIGAIYARTTNPPVCTGEGLALALRAGAVVADVEFVQFHPTALAVPGAGTATGAEARTGAGAGQVPLISEAVRGEGAVLLTGTGERLMAGVHPMADLAPRDVVAAAITRHLRATGEEQVWLDARSIPDLVARFPTITATCRGLGVDPVRDLIPVRPVAHYHCGGVLTDLNGRTTVPGLYAVGEVARTGLHGANRLASNSLVEAMVVAHRVATAIAASDRDEERPAVRPDSGAGRLPRPGSDVTGLRSAMDRYAGVGRDPAGLATVLALLDAAEVPPALAARAAAAGPGAPEVPDAPDGTDTAGAPDAPDAAMLALAARAVLTAALDREESRGCHIRFDHPQPRPELQHSTCWRLADLDRDASLVRCAPPAVGRLRTPAEVLR